MPIFGATAPLYYYGIPAVERGARCQLSTDMCVIDGTKFFIRGCIELHVHEADEPFVWGVWASLSREHFEEFNALFDSDTRASHGPFFGWLSAALPTYPDTENLKTLVHLRDNGLRPYIELEPTEHPLAVEQRNGISVDRVAELYAACMH